MMKTLHELLTRKSATNTELVELLNEYRTEGEPRLRRDHFKRKAVKVLGNIDQFRREDWVYRFPRREACLIVMSYSNELQAAIFDALSAKRRRSVKPVTP